MADTDMFMTQEHVSFHDQEGTDLYTKLQTAITVRQCKILQKKEKLKLFNDSTKRLNSDFKTALTEKKNIQLETTNISNQKTMGIMNLNSVKCSRASLETVLCDLTNKILNEKAKTLSKKEEYNAHIKDAKKTWEEYKIIYEEFPLAAQRREFIVNIKKVEIEKKIALGGIEGWKRMRKLKKDIAEKRLYIWGVNLAKLYFKIQEEKSKQMTLKIKKRHLDQEITKLTLNKKTNLQLHTPKLTQHARNDISSKQTLPDRGQRAPKMFSFQMPLMQVKSPTRGIGQTKKSSGGSLFDWASLLGSRLKNAVNKIGTKQPDNEQKKATAATNMPNKTKTKNQPDANVGSNIKKGDGGNQLIKNISTDVRPEGNRKRGFETNKLPEEKTNQPTQKRVCNIQKPLEKQQLNKIKSTISDNATFVPSKQKVNVDAVKEKKAEVHNMERETINPRESTNITINMSNLTNTKKNTRQLKSNSISKNDTTDKLRNQSNQGNDSKLINTVNNISVPADKLPPPITKTDHNETQSNKEQDLFDSSQKQSDYTMMDVTSPPDVIPVENNSQPLSQGNSSQNISGKYSITSDFASPVLDEAAKLAYQRIAAESPGFIYPRGDVHKSKLGTVNEDVVRSQYFTNDVASQDSSLNTPTMNMTAENHQQPPLSPPPVDYPQITSPMMNTNITSPPNATIGKGYSPAMSLFGKPRAEEQKTSGFDFNFTSGPPKQKSFFSLF